MPKVNKIVQFGLEQEVDDMQNKGLSFKEIVDQLKFNHPEIIELNKLSMMSISRYFKDKQIKEYSKGLLNGEKPEDALRSEFREKMFEIEEQTIDLYRTAKKALMRLEKEGSNEQIIKMVRETSNLMDQRRRNWSTLIDQGYRQFGLFKEAEQHNYVQVNNLLINLSNELCPECKKKVVNLILDKEEEDKDKPKIKIGGEVIQ